MAISLLVVLLLFVDVYSENKFMPHFAKERTYTCEDRQCTISCSTGHCGNEVFKSKKENFDADSDTLEQPQIIVNCQEFLSCYGQIKIQQFAHSSSSLLALPYQRAGRSAIKCSDSTEEQSCRGGVYIFEEFSRASMIGNARESIIAFKNGGVAHIYARGKLQEETQFYMNQVYTDNLSSFGVVAGDFAVTGSYIDLRGLQTKFGGLSIFRCRGINSCSGLILVVKYCGPQIRIMCDGKGSCGMLSIFLTKGDCEEKEGKFPGIEAWKKQKVTRQSTGNKGELIEHSAGYFTKAYKTYPWKEIEFAQKPTVIISGKQNLENQEEPFTPVNVYVVCTDLCEEYAAEQVAISEFMVDPLKKEKMRGVLYEPFDGTLHRYYSMDDWIKETQKHLSDLNGALKTTQDKQYEDALKYIFNDGHSTFAGIMFEATLSQVTAQAARIPWILGQEFDQTILRAIGVGLATVSGAIVLPLIIPGIIMAGFGVYYVVKRVMGKEEKKASYFGARIEKMNNMMDDEGMAMNDNVDMDLYGLQLNSNGEVIEYDVLTGEIHGYEMNNQEWVLYNEDDQLVSTEIFGLYFAGLTLIFCCSVFIGSFICGFFARKFVKRDVVNANPKK